MRKKLHCSARVSGIKMHLLRAADCAEFAKKAEFANILFNIMSERRAKRGYKRRKGIAAFREWYEQYRRQCGVKRDGKKNGKRC
jgi:hypothetical protein